LPARSAAEIRVPEDAATLQLAIARLQSGDAAADPVVRRSLDRIAEIGEQLGDPSIRAMPLAMSGLMQVFTGPIRQGVEALEEAVPLLEDHKDFIGAAFARGSLAIGYANLGEFDKAEVASRNATELAANGDLIAQLDAQIAESMLRSARGQVDQALPLALACMNRAEETGALVFVHPTTRGFNEGVFQERYLWNLVGNPMETTIAAAHMVLNGTMERHPGLHVLLAHGGGAILALRGRLRHGHEAIAPAGGVLKEPADASIGRFLFDTVTHDAEVLSSLVETVGADRVLLGSDYPFDMADRDPVATVRAAGLDVRIQTPGDPSSPLRLLAAGKRLD